MHEFATLHFARVRKRAKGVPDADLQIRYTLEVYVCGLRCKKDRGPEVYLTSNPWTGCPPLWPAKYANKGARPLVVAGGMISPMAGANCRQAGLGISSALFYEPINASGR